MAQRADVIRHDIENTRAAMTVKLALLEGRVLETVAGAQASMEKIMEDVGGIVKDVRGTVEDVGGIVKDVRATVDTTLEDVGGIVKDVRATVDTTLVAVRQGVTGTQASMGEMMEQVKGTLGDTVATVKHTFDLPAQTQQHPWTLMGGAVLVGYMLGRWGDGHPSAAGPMAERSAEAARSGSPPASQSSSARPQPQQGIVNGILDQFQDEIAGFKSVAVGAVMNTLSGMFQNAVPTLAPHIKSAMDKVSAQLSDSPAQRAASKSDAVHNGGPY